MYYSGKLQNLLRMRIQLLQFPNCLGKGPYLKEMVNVMKISLIKFDHLLCCGCY